MPGKTFRSLLGWAFPSRWMRQDWDRRAREAAQHFIACGHSETDSAFWESGRRDLDQAVLKDVELPTDARALEIGCGIGRLLRPLSEKAAKAYGVDISSEMVDRARRALSDRGNVEIFVTRGSLNMIPDASLDFVYSFIVFQHIPTKRAVSRYIREAARVLAGGGVFRFQVDGRPRRRGIGADTWLGVWYEPRELAQGLGKAGFEPLNFWGEHTHYLWVTARRLDQPGRPISRRVAVRRRSWDRAAVEAFAARLGEDSSQASAVMSGNRSLRQIAERYLARHIGEPPEDFVRLAYQAILGREADAGGLGFYTKEIAGGVHRSNTIDCLVSSPELEERLRPEIS